MTGELAGDDTKNMRVAFFEDNVNTGIWKRFLRVRLAISQIPGNDPVMFNERLEFCPRLTPREAKGGLRRWRVQDALLDRQVGALPFSCGAPVLARFSNHLGRSVP